MPAERPRRASAATALLARSTPDGGDAAYRAAAAERLRSAGEDARAAALADPWSFKAWLVGADGDADGGEQPARNRLLHALFPRTFEPIAAPEEKHAIADALGSLAADEDRDDVDRTLFAVRTRLERARRARRDQPAGRRRLPRPAAARDLGRGRARPARTRSGLSHLDALRHKQQVVLYGPPGTGKTFEAKALADRLIRDEAIRRWGPVEYLQQPRARLRARAPPGAPPAAAPGVLLRGLHRSACASPRTARPSPTAATCSS